MLPKTFLAAVALLFALFVVAHAALEAEQNATEEELTAVPRALGGDTKVYIALNDLSLSLLSEIWLPGTCEYSDSIYHWSLNSDFPNQQPLPAVVVRPKKERDVVEIVNWARRFNFEVGVKSGGHAYSSPALAPGGILIDLSLMDEVVYDIRNTHVTVGGGATIQKITEALKPFDRIPPVGICSHVGAGLIHGGWGARARLDGLALDNIVNIRLVTAEGRVWNVNALSDPDLWFAVRGAAANFGVVIAITYETEKNDWMTWGLITFSTSYDFPTVAKYLQENYDCDREVGVAAIMKAEGFDLLLWVWGGRHIDTLLTNLDRALPEACSFEIVVTGYDYWSFQEATYGYTGEWPSHAFSYTHSVWYDFPENLDDADSFLWKFASTPKTNPGEHTLGLFELWGGAINDVPNNKTAFGARGHTWQVFTGYYYYDPCQAYEVQKWSDEAHQALLEEPGVTDQVYINYVAATPENVASAYGENLERLSIAKAKFDCENFFHKNYNIPLPEKK